MSTMWERQDRSVLARLAVLDEQGKLGGGRTYQSGDLAEDLGMEPQRVDHIVFRFIDQGYVREVSGRGMTAGYIGIHGVTGAGLQALGEWPAPTGDLQPLVDALLAAAEQTDDDEERGRLRTMATWASEFSQDVAANVAAAAAIYGIGGLG